MNCIDIEELSCTTKMRESALLNNSEKELYLLRFFGEFSQQIVEGCEFVLAKFLVKRPIQSTKICDLSPNKVELLAVFHPCVQNPKYGFQNVYVIALTERSFFNETLPTQSCNLQPSAD